MKKKFDAIAFKHKVQQEIYEETKDLSPEELVEYFNKAGERFRRELEALREKKNKAQQKKRKKSTSTKSNSSVTGSRSKT
jgi:ElaB/YqjD/DUF883 family membrane-anchored ribosome-binding protein